MCKALRKTRRVFLRNFIRDTPLLEWVARRVDIQIRVAQLHHIWLDAWRPETHGKLLRFFLPAEVEENVGRLTPYGIDKLPGVRGGRFVRAFPYDIQQEEKTLRGNWAWGTVRYLHEPYCHTTSIEHDCINAGVHERVLWGVEELWAVLGQYRKFASGRVYEVWGHGPLSLVRYVHFSLQHKFFACRVVIAPQVRASEREDPSGSGHECHDSLPIEDFASFFRVL